MWIAPQRTRGSLTKRAFVLHRKSLSLPLFMPDATFGFVKSVLSQDLKSVGIQALVMNAFHLMQKPGSSVVQSLGGLHQMAGWENPIITDSGGFQAYSLIHQNKKFGSLNENGIIFRPEGTDRKLQLTPEKSIQLQVGFESDVVICLDDCTHVDAPYSEQELSVNRTIAWASRCKKEFEHQVELRKLPVEKTPQIFGVIQGGGFFDLRKRCAEALLEIGFDGFGFGGWPLDSQGNLLVEILQQVRELIPQQFLIHALGIGHPENLLTCFNLGYDIFDCAMPTRDARHGRLYAMNAPASRISDPKDWFHYAYIGDERWIKNAQPISPLCDCPCCAHYSIGYLHHLFKMNDNSYHRLATLHNLRFMTQLTGLLADEQA